MTTATKRERYLARKRPEVWSALEKAKGDRSAAAGMLRKSLSDFEALLQRVGVPWEYRKPTAVRRISIGRGQPKKGGPSFCSPGKLVPNATHILGILTRWLQPYPGRPLKVTMDPVSLATRLRCPRKQAKKLVREAIAAIGRHWKIAMQSPGGVDVYEAELLRIIAQLSRQSGAANFAAFQRWLKKQ